MTLASSYKMLFVGPEDVCFVKQKRKKSVFLPVDFLCCRFCTNALLFGACCNFGVVTGCVSHRASTCHVKKQIQKKKSVYVQKCLYFLRKISISLE